MHYTAKSNTIKQVGGWNQQDRLTVFDAETLTAVEDTNDIETLIVVTKEETPYVMLKRSGTGNAAYDGFAIDLLKV